MPTCNESPDLSRRYRQTPVDMPLCRSEQERRPQRLERVPSTPTFVGRASTSAISRVISPVAGEVAVGGGDGSLGARGGDMKPRTTRPFEEDCEH